MIGNLHLLDIATVVAYLAIVLYIGKRASKRNSSEEGFFLAGRSLGKLYQFFLNFGNATDASGAVSTSSLVYQKGVSGVWMALQTIFMNPYYWFMSVWFRRVRLITVADLFVDRFGTQGLARFYAIFQVVATVFVVIGYGNLVAYKVTSSLLVKPETTWSASEHASVAGYQEMLALEKPLKAGETLAPAATVRLEELHERNKAGELRRTISYLDSRAGKWGFYLLFSLIVGTYIVVGGMSAIAVNEAFQGILIIIFSALLIPSGLAALGGVGTLSQKVPPADFQLLNGGGIGLLELTGIWLISIVQIHAIVANMGVYGSAKNEFSARFGAVSGTFLKRLMIILWAFCGLIAIALYQGADTLSDPDSVWGTMSLHLLRPGFLGLMMAGLLAASMSALAAQTMAASALFSRNVYQYLMPRTTERGMVLAGRLSIVVILGAGMVAAANMDNVYNALQLMLTVNVPFGASVVLLFFWRRLTAKAIWATVLISALVNIVGPVCIGDLVPALRRAPALQVQTVDVSGRESAVYFERVVRVNPDDPTSERLGRGRLNIELILLDRLGLPVESLTPTHRNAMRFLFNGLFPFVILILVSLLTRPPAKERTDLFFGKLKTPIGDTPELEEAAVEETRRNPHRFDDCKLLGAGSNWEFTKWDRVDTLGFVACVAISFTILGAFVALLKWVS